MHGISIVTGTLNRQKYLPDLIANTVNSGSGVKVELVLVDGGSTDGTIEYLEELNHSSIKLIKHGTRSSYPHYMSLGIINASYDLICQWNDDVLLINSWDEVLGEIDTKNDAYLFNWKLGQQSDAYNSEWLRCTHMRDNDWIIINNADYKYPQMAGEQRGEVVMNYGIYKTKVFGKYGLYNPHYQYYCADGEMAMRAYYGGCKFKSCVEIKVLVLPAEKRAIMMDSDVQRYYKDCRKYTEEGVE
jgi:glycosyltransferase involved in cell wall biosynthesis